MKFVMSTWLIALAIWMTHAGAEDSGLPTIAYHAQAVTVSEGTSITFQIVSDGLRTNSVMENEKGEKSGSYTDRQRNLQWIYGPGFPCIQAPLYPVGRTHEEELLGSEVIDQHPTQKFSVSDNYTIDGKAISEVATEWRATDLENMVIRATTDKGKTFHLRNIVVVTPYPDEMVLPPGCTYDEMQDTSRLATMTSGGYRTVQFSDLSCKRLVSLPLTFDLPADFDIREGGPPPSCFAGRPDDLAMLLKGENELHFDELRHGVFWLHVSDSTYYDAARKRFVSGEGSDDQWPDAWERTMGARDVKMMRKVLFGIPMLRVTAHVGNQSVRMLFLGIDDSPAIRISFQPASSDTSGDESQWRHFIDSIAQAK